MEHTKNGPRVVSLLPSATEMLGVVGGLDLLVGRSHECDHAGVHDHGASDAALRRLPVLTAPKIAQPVAGDPHGFDPAAVDRQVVAALAPADGGNGGSTGGGGANASLYTLFADQLAALRPDVILTQDLCEVCSIDVGTVRRVAAQLHPAPQVVSLNPTSVEGVLDDVLTVGRAVGRERAARDVVVGLRQRLFEANEHVNPFDDGPVLAFLEWTDPLFCAGHWTVQLIERAGARHPFNPTRAKRDAGAAVGPQSGERIAGKSRRMSVEELIEAQPTRLVVCPCGLDLATTRACVTKLAQQRWWGELPAVRLGRVALVDGNQMFNRPGPRLVDAYEWLVGWLHDRPELIGAGFPCEPWPAGAAPRAYGRSAGGHYALGMDKPLTATLGEARGVLDELLRDGVALEAADKGLAILVDTLRGGGKVLACGNGGSLCDAQHFCEELTGRFRADRPALAAIACADAGHITCTANDYGYEQVFARWVQALGRAGDTLVLLSTSGNSPNCLHAARAARERGVHTLGLLGKGGGHLRGLVDVPIIVPGATADRIQELHMLLLHAYVEGIERGLGLVARTP